MVYRNCLPATFFDVFEEDPSLEEYIKQRWLFTLIRKQYILNLDIACDAIDIQYCVKERSKLHDPGKFEVLSSLN